MILTSILKKKKKIVKSMHYFAQKRILISKQRILLKFREINASRKKGGKIRQLESPRERWCAEVFVFKSKTRIEEILQVKRLSYIFFRCKSYLGTYICTYICKSSSRTKLISWYSSGPKGITKRRRRKSCKCLFKDTCLLNDRAEDWINLYQPFHVMC